MALIDNQVSYWKLDESSGNASDSEGSNTLTNSNVTYQAGKINNGALWNSATDVLQIADGSQSGLDITGDISFSFWVKLTSQPGSGTFQMFIWKYLASGSQRAYQLYY